MQAAIDRGEIDAFSSSESEEEQEQLYCRHCKKYFTSQVSRHI
jgi:uncharacterized protein YbaR (Trm112 family)